MNVLSDECIARLGDYLDGDEDEVAEIFKAAGIYVEITRSMSKFKPDHKAATEKRLARLKKAFDGLTPQDKAFLDVNVAWQTEGVDDIYKPDKTCDKMLFALDQTVPSMRGNASRKAMLTFAKIAVRNDWIDVSVESTCLAAVIKILMEEAGVKHDAVAIALEAVKTA